jgi:hypothetical protein
MDDGDMEAFVERIQSGDHGPRTVTDHATAIKGFWKWPEGKDEAYLLSVDTVRKTWRATLSRSSPVTNR